jgi:UDP-glucuronate 4-epimerase
VQVAVVTGGAGFIGSHLVERLLHDGWRVRAVDAFTDYYDPALKRSNLESCRPHPCFELVDTDLATDDLEPLLTDTTAVFHLAGQPGVRASWRDGFAEYTRQNVLATQRLLEAAHACAVPRFVYSSSSSVYGQALSYPTRETDLPQPHSPYGVTKLAAEHLSTLYARNFGLHTVSLRYFTVFGPRQRPDMAMHRLIESCLRGTPFPLYGDGSAIRDFTFVDDVVEANMLAATVDVPAGIVLNVAGGSETSLAEVISVIEELAARPVLIDQRDSQPGDVRRTGGSTDQIRSALGWHPTVSLREGLGLQLEWHEHRLERPARVDDQPDVSG